MRNRTRDRIRELFLGHRLAQQLRPNAPVMPRAALRRMCRAQAKAEQAQAQQAFRPGWRRRVAAVA